MTDPIYVELPYDRGFPHHLRTATDKAVISEHLANWLLECGVQRGFEGVPDQPPQTVAWHRMKVGDTTVVFDGTESVKLSRKAAGLLRKASTTSEARKA